MHFSTKKMGVKFFHRKKTKPVSPRGVWQKTRLFPDFFFRLPSLIRILRKMGEQWPIEIIKMFKHSNANFHKKHQDFADNGKTMAYRNPRNI